jgi:DNA repair exonuclease SbcCD nuclease subunit
MIKIFHTGDNHLDSAFARLSPSARERERARQRDLFVKMMNYAREEKFDLVLISGDLFDSPTVSPETEKAVIGAFASLSCPVVISPGNHDPYSEVGLYSSGLLPDNVYVFNSPELQVFELEELSVSVCGYAFTSDEYSKSPLEDLSLDDIEGVRLLCAHGELGVASSKYAPISESQLSAFSYAALGHVHKLADPVKIGKGLAAYCGFPEGRAFDEEGLGGAMSVTVDGDRASAERVIFAERQYVYDSLDVSGTDRDGELVDRAAELLDSKGYDQSTALRLTLEGALSIDYTPDRSLVERMLAGRLLSIEIIDDTTPEIDLKSLENDYTLRGEVYKALKSRLESDDAGERKKAFDALKIALLAIEGKRISY